MTTLLCKRSSPDIIQISSLPRVETLDTQNHNQNQFCVMTYKEYKIIKTKRNGKKIAKPDKECTKHGQVLIVIMEIKAPLLLLLCVVFADCVCRMRPMLTQFSPQFNSIWCWKIFIKTKPEAGSWGESENGASFLQPDVHNFKTTAITALCSSCMSNPLDYVLRIACSL